MTFVKHEHSLAFLLFFLFAHHTHHPLLECSFSHGLLLVSSGLGAGPPIFFLWDGLGDSQRDQTLHLLPAVVWAAGSMPWVCRVLQNWLKKRMLEKYSFMSKFCKTSGAQWTLDTVGLGGAQPPELCYVFWEFYHLVLVLLFYSLTIPVFSLLPGCPWHHFLPPTSPTLMP